MILRKKPEVPPVDFLPGNGTDLLGKWVLGYESWTKSGDLKPCRVISVTTVPTDSASGSEVEVQLDFGFHLGGRNIYADRYDSAAPVKLASDQQVRRWVSGEATYQSGAAPDEHPLHRVGWILGSGVLASAILGWVVSFFDQPENWNAATLFAVLGVGAATTTVVGAFATLKTPKAQRELQAKRDPVIAEHAWDMLAQAALNRG
jgi:hypothetical protein